MTGFLGSDNKPMPISEPRPTASRARCRRASNGPRPTISFEVGEKVRVGRPLRHFQGMVEEVDEGRSRVKVAVSIFGRATPVELEYGQVDKLG